MTQKAPQGAHTQVRHTLKPQRRSTPPPDIYATEDTHPHNTVPRRCFTHQPTKPKQILTTHTPHPRPEREREEPHPPQPTNTRTPPTTPHPSPHATKPLTHTLTHLLASHPEMDSVRAMYAKGTDGETGGGPRQSLGPPPQSHTTSQSHSHSPISLPIQHTPFTSQLPHHNNSSHTHHTTHPKETPPHQRNPSHKKPQTTPQPTTHHNTPTHGLHSTEIWVFHW